MEVVHHLLGRIVGNIGGILVASVGLVQAFIYEKLKEWQEDSHELRLYELSAIRG
jgi:hypothetical protein